MDAQWSTSDAVIVCLPGSGGPELVDAVRDELGDRRDVVRLISIADLACRTMAISTCPLGMGGWLPGDDLVACQTEAARALASRLSWLLWEVGIRVDRSIATEDVRLLVAQLVTATELSTMIVASSCRPRWRQALRAVTASAPPHVRLRIAVDSPTPAIRRWAARAGF